MSKNRAANSSLQIITEIGSNHSRALDISLLAKCPYALPPSSYGDAACKTRSPNSDREQYRASFVSSLWGRAVPSTGCAMKTIATQEI
jgi:hypothetical protein